MNQFPQKLQEWDCIWGRGRSHRFAAATFFFFNRTFFFPPSSFSNKHFFFFPYSPPASLCPSHQRRAGRAMGTQSWARGAGAGCSPPRRGWQPPQGFNPPEQSHAWKSPPKCSLFQGEGAAAEVTSIQPGSPQGFGGCELTCDGIHHCAHHHTLGASVLPKLPPCVTTEPEPPPFPGDWLLRTKLLWEMGLGSKGQDQSQIF